MQLRFETFNTLNHTQFTNPGAGISAPNPNTAVTAATAGNSGRLTGTRDPRNMQLGLKLLF